MAITDAQQAKQIMMKKGGPVVQAGVKNYKPSKMVTVPKTAKSSPTHPTAHLAYITDAEKKLLIKKNLHGSLKGKPNRGPGGIPSLQGDFGGPGGFGGFEGGGGSRSDNDVSGRTDTGTGYYRVTDRKAQQEYDRNRAAREKAAKEKAEKDRIQKEIDKYNKAQAKKTKAFKNKTMADLLAEEEDETDDIASGAMLDLFINDPMRIDRPERFMPLSLKVLEGPLKKGQVKTRGFFADPNYKSIFGRPKKSVLEAGRYQYKGAPLTAERFAKMSLTEQNKAYKDYMSDRLSGKTDAYGNVSAGYMRDGSGNIISTGNDRDSQQPIIPPIAQQPKDDETEEEDFQLALAFRKDGGRVPYEDGGYTGGIMDLESGRQMYFLGKLVKKATRAVKKIVKSPVGKIGLGALMLGGTGGFSGIGSMLTKFKGLGGLKGIGDAIGGMSFGKKALLSVGGGLLAGALAGKGYQDEDGDGFDDKTGFSVEEYRRRGAQGNVPIAFRAEGGMSDVESDPQYKGWKRIFEVNPEAAEMHPKHTEFVKYYRSTERATKAEGGMMDLKGMEMDFRDDGGFVPIGKKERADDVPARLSKNEFVMTADAVRGAGDGDIDKGAQKMYNLMSKLEAENDQPQGLDGARKMFQTAKRLEEVL